MGKRASVAVHEFLKEWKSMELRRRFLEDIENALSVSSRGLRKVAKEAPAWMKQETHDRANRSELRARRRHGDKAVTEATRAAMKAGLAEHFITQRHPYPALMKWFLSGKKPPSIRRERAAE